MARIASICPHCRSIIPARGTCGCRGSARPAYNHASYRSNRHTRYMLARGRCEACDVELKGALHPHGIAWECDHHLEARRFTDPNAANEVANLRVYCRKCHEAKTRRSQGE
jgi:uncharacterized 2Fe-2S/4Fe-4S cluster protein (DUF4445 family)